MQASLYQRGRASTPQDCAKSLAYIFVGVLCCEKLRYSSCKAFAADAATAFLGTSHSQNSSWSSLASAWPQCISVHRSGPETLHISSFIYLLIFPFLSLRGLPYCRHHRCCCSHRHVLEEVLESAMLHHRLGGGHMLPPICHTPAVTWYGCELSQKTSKALPWLQLEACAKEISRLKTVPSPQSDFPSSCFSQTLSREDVSAWHITTSFLGCTSWSFHNPTCPELSSGVQELAWASRLLDLPPLTLALLWCEALLWLRL